MKKISFVIPCYRSEHTLPHVVAEIREKMKGLEQYEYDIFLVNDCSPDDTFGTSAGSAVNLRILRGSVLRETLVSMPL